VTAVLHRLAPTEVELEIEIPAADLEAARERAYKKLVKQFRIPGFRPGRAPRRILEQHVGAERLEHEAIDDAVPEAYASALREHSLEPVDRPKLDVERSDDGKALRVKATVAVRPEIALGDYASIRVSLPPTSVSDEEVENSLQALRRRAATLEPVIDRGIESGDVVTLDYEGTVDGKPFEGGSAHGHTTEITDQKFIPGFAEQLFGARPGERRDVRVTFPPTYQAAGLAGKPAVFDVLVQEVKTPVLPAVDDDFAKLVSESETIDALRSDIRKRLELVAGQRARDGAEQELIQRLLDTHDFPLPEVLVSREVERIRADAKDSVERSGGEWEAYLREQQLDENKLSEDMRARARSRVKSSLLIEAIAKAENVEATEADITREINRMARSMRQPAERIVGWLREGGGFSRLVDAVRREKTVDRLLDAALKHEPAVGQPSGTMTAQT